MSFFNNHIFKILCLSLITFQVSAKVIVVAQTSIKKAIAEANPYDEIVIKKGVYKEGNLLIDKPLILKGEAGSILDGETKYEVISVKANDVVIENLTIQNSGFSSIQDLAGVRLYGVQRCKIINNQFKNTFFGIYMTNSGHCIIENNHIIAGDREAYNIGNGIHLWKCDSATIQYNEISKHRDGIYFEFVTNSVIQANDSHENLRYGLHFMFSHSNLYQKNIFKNNGAGVAVMYSNHVTMLNNRFLENQGSSAYGLLLKDISDSRIEGNSYEKNTVGIHMEGASRILFERNTFKENGYAFKLQASCDANTLKLNNFKGNTFDIATNGSLVLNTLENNYWDKYEGYDLNKDGKGDVPYRPISLFSMIIERVPYAAMMIRSFVVTLLDKFEKIIPSLTPENLKDSQPLMKPV